MLIAPVRTTLPPVGATPVPSAPAAPAGPPSEIPLDTSAPNYRWAPTPGQRITYIPRAKSLNGIMPLSDVQVTRNHWRGGEQRSMIRPTAIVIHSTGGGAYMTGDDWRRDIENRGVGAQYYIMKSGEIVELQSSNRRAWHVAAQANNGNWNSESIGIELSNASLNASGTDRYPVKQIEALRRLTRYLATKYTIPRESLVMHRQLQPADRSDPVGFPWHHFLRSVGHDRPWTGPIFQRHPNDPGVPAWQEEPEIPQPDHPPTDMP